MRMILSTILIGLFFVINYLFFKNPLLDYLKNKDGSCGLNTNYRYYSSKTDYVIVANSSNLNDYRLPKCEQIGLWHLSRHGGRYPDSKNIIAMDSVLTKIKEQLLLNKNSWLCGDDLKRLKTWKLNMKPQEGDYLTSNGRLHMRQLGSRMQYRLYEFAARLKIPSQVRFQATNIIRTAQSAQEYIAGFFDNLAVDQRPNYTVNQADDYLLKFPDICQRYIKEVDSNSSACSEIDYFQANSPLYKQAIAKFILKLGLNLTSNDLNEAFNRALDTCEYEYLMDGTDSIWCKFFDEDTLRLIEYVEDLQYNCDYGYRYNISRDMTCDLVSNLLSSLIDYKNGYENRSENTTKMNVLFSHTSTLLPFVANMGLGYDVNNFNYSNVLKINANRKFRVSTLNPMNTNIAFVLYNCAPNKYTLRVFHNENLVQVNGCKSVDCDLDDLLNYFQQFTNRCKSTQSVCSSSAA